jgi:hypothetical protein
MITSPSGEMEVLQAKINVPVTKCLVVSVRTDFSV